MNYKVLYRKYRPDSFDELTGQEHVIEILKNSIVEEKIAHAYMFSGPRGTGKTSTARILAKSINCLNNKNGVACGECDACKSFSSSPDIIEIDAASNSGVDEIRGLINNVKIMPSGLKYKIYIIDEVHMLSSNAFNALLLTLEEPPEHVIFILATTNLENVPITILSRCQRFDFKRLQDSVIVDRLKMISDKEQIKYEEDALREIATLSDGGLRDALSILDQLSKGGETITTDLVAKEIGTISNQKIKELIIALDEQNIKKVEEIFLEFQSVNLNYKVIIKKLIYILSDYGVQILNNDCSLRMTFDEIKKLVMELNDLMNKISINIDPYLLIKMTFLGFINVTEKNVSEINKEEKIIINDSNQTMVKTAKNEDIKNDNFVQVEKIVSNVSDKFINIRINNCFVKASKNYLLEIKPQWEKFIANVDNAQIKGLVSDTQVVTSSDNYAIIVSMIPHKEKEINENLKEIEKIFGSFLGKDYMLVFLSESRWEKEKEVYINNLKNKYIYKYQNEDIGAKNENSDIDFSKYASVFDIDKIELV